MIDKIKKFLNLTDDEQGLDDLAAIEEERKAELDEVKEKFADFDYLFPFEEIELIEAKASYLKAKSKTLYHAIVKVRDNSGQSKGVDKKYISTLRELEDLEKKKNEMLKKGITSKLKHKGFRLDKDPRKKIKAKMKARENLQKENKLIEERLNLVEQLEENRKDILNNAAPLNRNIIAEDIAAVSEDAPRRMKVRYQNNKAELERDYKADFKAVEKELAEIREEKELFNSL